VRVCVCVHFLSTHESRRDAKRETNFHTVRAGNVNTHTPERQNNSHSACRSVTHTHTQEEAESLQRECSWSAQSGGVLHPTRVAGGASEPMPHRGQGTAG